MPVELNLSKLRELQALDSEIHDLQQRAAEQREVLDELRTAHESLTESLEVENAQLEATRKLLREKERELEENDERFASSKQKLSDVSNTKQYNALEKEMDSLRKMRAHIEEERDTLRENLENFEAQRDERARKLEALQADIEQKASALQAEESAQAGRIGKLEKQRQKVKEEIPKPFVRKYEFVLSKRPGSAVVAAVNGICGACKIAMPPQRFNELILGRTLIQCSSCQRILFYQSADENAQA
jgi:predicted  nucleic acid-binding Zn-ribbon protein